MSVPYDQMQELPEMQLEMETHEPVEEAEEYRSPLLDYLDQGNLVDELENQETGLTNSGVTAKILELYQEADESMDKWRKKYKRALSLAKLQAMSGDVEINEKNTPFEGASLVMLPYILEAMLDFSSRAAGELVWADNIVKAKVYGEKTDEKEARADRVSKYSNYQISEMMPDWRTDQDKGLLILASPGTFYKCSYFDYDTQEVCSELCLADEIIFNHNYKSFDKAPDKFRKCEYTRNEVIGFIRGSQDWLIDESDLEEDENIFEFIKCYTWIDLDDDGLKEPYIATIWEEKNKIVCLYPYFDEDTITMSDDDEIIKIESLDCFTQYRFLPDPEGGAMGMGWGILLGSMFDSINTNMRQLLDAGTIANSSANSGLISQSLASGRGNATEAAPIELIIGQLTPVSNHGSGSLRDSIVQMPFSGASPVLFQLMEYLISSSRSMTNAAVNVEAQAGEAASLYLARLQQGLKIPNSIIMRVYDCAKKEFQKISKLNYKHYDDEKYNRVIDEDKSYSMEQDFNPEDCDIRMTADPTQGSDIERVQRAETVYQMAKDPQQPSQVINYRDSVLGVLEAMNVPNVDQLAPEPDPNQKDPMQELMIAQSMAEMEITQGNLDVRKQELSLKKMKMAMDSAKEQVQLGLMNDKQEAEIFSKYAAGLKSLSDAGMAVSLDAIKQIEERFIGDNRGGQIPQNNPSPTGNMDGQPSDTGLPPMP